MEKLKSEEADGRLLQCFRKEYHLFVTYSVGGTVLLSTDTMGSKTKPVWPLKGVMKPPVILIRWGGDSSRNREGL